MNAQALRLLHLLDLTRLQPDDDATVIARLCSQAVTAFGKVAAVCVWPRFVPLCKERLAGTSVRVATVVNFPDGGSDLAQAVAETERAIALGADEVDLVFPYKSWLAGEGGKAGDLVRACKQVCGTAVTLKIILETGALPTPQHIASVSREAIDAGADFFKTSTGKIDVGATLAAATVMLAAIKESGKPVGFKAAGGIHTLTQALSYLELAEGMMGSDWVRPDRFRIGASALLDDLLRVLAHDSANAAPGNHPPQA